MRKSITLFSAALLAAFLSSCATNPVTGQSELSLVPESQEIEMGRTGAKQTVASIGLYDDKALQDYVGGLGMKLATASERPGLPWAFHVIDDPVVNAFAMPGGFIFVTRGILTHMNSEAELVSVLGHEIGHVTAKHSVRQISRSQLAQIGLGVGTILAPNLEPLANLAAAGLGLLFLKYSRGDETQADDLGFRYMLNAGYDVHEMTKMFDTLGRTSKLEGGKGLPEWASTHPNPENRVQKTQARIAAAGRDLSGLTVNQDVFLKKLDGIVFGDDPRAGYFKGSSFFHPDMAFRIDFPDGWKTANQPNSVVAASQSGDAIVQLTIAGKNEPAESARTFVSEQGIESTPVQSRSIGGLNAATTHFRATTSDGVLEGLATFIAYKGNTYRVMGVTGASKFSQFEQAFDRSASSFRQVTDPSILSVKAARLELVKVPSTMSLAEFQKRYPSTIPIERVALINGLEPGSSIAAGRTMKRVVGGALP